MDDDIPIITIEGLPGCGKKEYIKTLSKFLNISGVMYNPSNCWKYKNLFELFYNNPIEWSLPLLLNSTNDKINNLNKFYEILRKSKITTPIIVEKTIYSDFRCYLELFKNYNYVDDSKYDIYKNIFNSLKEKYKKVHLVIYLRCPVKKCLNYNNKDDYYYLLKLAYYYDKWLLEEKHDFQVFVINLEEPYINNLENYTISIKRLFEKNIFLKKFRSS